MTTPLLCLISDYTAVFRSTCLPFAFRTRLRSRKCKLKLVKKPLVKSLASASRTPHMIAPRQRAEEKKSERIGLGERQKCARVLEYRQIQEHTRHTM